MKIKTIVRSWRTPAFVRAPLFLMLALCTNSFSQGVQWFPRGTGGGGALYSPSINPANDDECYVGCDMSGLYRSTNFGSTFSLMDCRQIQGGHNAKMQFTSDPRTLYCITYADDLAVPAASTDGGSTWHPLPGNPDAGEETFSLSADYNLPSHVIISTYSEIFASTNGGATFSVVHAAKNPGSGVVVGGALFDGSTIYLGTSDGLLVSTNGGVSFSEAPVNGLGAGEKIVSFAGAKRGSALRFYCLTADSNNVYVGVPGTDYWGFLKGVYSLAYGSGNWTPKMNGISSATDFLMYVAMAQNDTATVYLAGSTSSGEPNVMKTTNGGAVWTHVFLTTNNANISTGWSGAGGDRGWTYGECALGFSVAPNNARRVVLTDLGFVHTTTDGGGSWRQAYVLPEDQNAAGQLTPMGRNYRSNGLEVTSCWQVFWTDALAMFGAFTDIKGMRSTDGGQSWSFNYSGHTANTMYRITQHPVNGTLFAATSNVHDMYESTRLQDAQLDASDAAGKIISSTDKGAHWTDVHAFSHPVFWIALDPHNPNRMYASVIHSTQGGIYETSDLQHGASSVWTKLPNPPRTEGHPATIVVLQDSSVVCTYSGRRTGAGFTASSGVFVFTPSTNSWSDRSDAGMRYWTRDIVVDPFDPTQRRWYVGVFSGWGGPPNGLGGLYRTTDRGNSWTKISNLDRVTSCTINPLNASEMYLTTEVEGLWRTPNLDAVSPVISRVDSYPFRHPERVFYNPFNLQEIWVTSFGGGMMVGTVQPSGVRGGSGRTPSGFVLDQCYPNPFNPSATIHYTLSRGGAVTLAVYDCLGARVAVLVSGMQERGNHEARFDGGGLASGVYFCRLQAEGSALTRKMLLLK